MSGKIKRDLLKYGNAKCVSCRICAGQLLPDETATLYEGRVPEDIIYAFYSRAAERYFLCTDSDCYVSGNGEDFIQLNALAGKSPFAVEEIVDGVGRAVVINGSSAVAHNGSSFMAFGLKYALSCGVMHCGRLFGGDADDGLLLRWSGEGGVRDWEEGLTGCGSVRLDPERGRILNVLEYGGKLVIVRERGLTVADMYGSPENFAVRITDTDTDGIYKNTAAVAGGKLLFYTVSGLAEFDGNAVRKVGHRMAGDASAPTYSLGKGEYYYLACRSDIFKGPAILRYDTGNGQSCVIDAIAYALCDDGDICAYNSTGLQRIGGAGRMSYLCGDIYFGESHATLTEIRLQTEGVDVEISCGAAVRKFYNASGVIRPRMRGTQFGIKLTGAKPVYGAAAVAEVMNGV